MMGWWGVSSSRSMGVIWTRGVVMRREQSSLPPPPRPQKVHKKMTRAGWMGGLGECEMCRLFAARPFIVSSCSGIRRMVKSFEASSLEL